MSHAILKGVLIALVVANLAAVAAWWAKDDLVAIGILAEPPPRHIELGKLPLPPIEAVPPEDESDPAGAEAVPPAPEQPPTVASCVVAGPFQDQAAAQTLAARFEEAGGSAEVDAETVAAAPAYLVYVAPDGAEAGARAWEELTAQAIDAYVIPSGARKDGVSVGVFSDQDRAEAQRDRVAGLGHSVLIERLPRTATRYRVTGREVPPDLAGTAVVPCDRAAAG